MNLGKNRLKNQRIQIFYDNIHARESSVYNKFNVENYFRLRTLLKNKQTRNYLKN